MGRPHHTSFLQLVHETSRTIITDGELALYERGRTLLMGHNQPGKAAERAQVCARTLAAGGVAVLIPDPVSQGERYQFLERDGKSWQLYNDELRVGANGVPSSRA